MKHLFGTIVLVASAFALKFWYPTNASFNIPLAGTYTVVSLDDAGFWLLLAIALIWLLVAMFDSRRSS
jgi:hypothetical protein